MDFIETEYFASTLYELIQATYERCIETLTVEELMKKPHLFIKGQATYDSDSLIHVVKLTTFLYKVHESNIFQDCIASQIRHTVSCLPSQCPKEMGGYQRQCSQLLKMVFFGNSAVYPIDMAHLLRDVYLTKAQNQPEGGEFDLIKQLLSGDLTKALEDESEP